MTNKTTIALAAALFAALATPALAQGTGVTHGYDYPTEAPVYQSQSWSHATQAPRLIEGRNAAVNNFGTAYGSTSTGRDAMVQSLGN